MSKEKLISLSRYSETLKNRLADPVIPEKHKNRANEYRQFLQFELKAVTTKIDYLKMNTTPDKK